MWCAPSVARRADEAQRRSNLTRFAIQAHLNAAGVGVIGEAERELDLVIGPFCREAPNTNAVVLPFQGGSGLLVARAPFRSGDETVINGAEPVRSIHLALSVAARRRDISSRIFVVASVGFEPTVRAFALGDLESPALDR